MNRTFPYNLPIGGTIVQKWRDTHEDLLALNGVYTQLYELWVNTA
jgi:hypothetical protein